jgi:membrane-bound serine protease (ClpP class)
MGRSVSQKTFLSILVTCLLFLIGESEIAWGEPSPEPVWKAKAPAGARIVKEYDGWFAPKPKVSKPEIPKDVTSCFVIPIREEIKGKTFQAVRRKAIRCRAKGAKLIVLDMDTYGGEIGPALDITRLIKRDLDDIYVVCFVNTRSISAGAMIALACDEIVMTPVGTLGDCAPILMGGKLEGVEREKIESPLRTEFEESAERNGYSVALATGMVSHDQGAWLVRHLQTHELRYVLADDFRDQVTNPPRKETADKKSVSKTEGRAGQPAQWEFLKVILPKGKLLTMTSKKAVEYGFAGCIVETTPSDPYAGLIQRFHITRPPVVLEDNWSENLVDFLTHPVVMGILVFLMLLFGYTEAHTPGFGVFGAIAITCLVILLAGQYLVSLAQWWEIAAFVIGLALLLVEIFLIPGFGVAGVSGIVLMVVALLAMLIPNAPDKLPVPDTPMGWELLRSGVMSVCLGFIGFLLAAAVVSRYLPKWSVIQNSRLVLAPAPAATQAPRPADSPMLRVSPGDRGVTETRLHPIGRVRFGDDLLDAISDGTMIEPRRPVRVLRCDGNRIVVEEVNE